MVLRKPEVECLLMAVKNYSNKNRDEVGKIFPIDRGFFPTF